MFSLAVLITCHFWDSVRLGFLYILNFYLGGGFRLWELSATTRWLGPLALGQVCLFGGDGQLLGLSVWGWAKKDDTAFFFKPMGIYTWAWSSISGLYDFPFLFCFIHSFSPMFDIYYLFDIFTIIHTCNYCG